MIHANAPLTVEGRHRLIERCQYRPIAHVAAEAGISRACLTKWKSRFERDGLAGLQDRSSAPHARPTMIAPDVVELIETRRREHHWTARAIRTELASHGHQVSLATIGRWLKRLGISRLRDLDPDGSTNRVVGTITARFPGHMVHLDVKKVGRIPDGGGHRAHGRDSAQNRTAQRAKIAGAKAGYVFLHSIVDGYSRLAYTEHLADEKATTTIGFYSRARVFFRAHGIDRVVTVVTDNGSNYRANDFNRVIAATASRHQYIRPYTPRHNGKVERYNRTLAAELLYSRIWLSEDQRAAAIQRWNIHYNYHRNHTAIGDLPPSLTPQSPRHQRHEPEHLGCLGHSHDAGVAGDEVGLCDFHCLQRLGRSASLLLGVQDTTCRTSRALRRHAMAPGGGFDDALRRWRRARHTGGRCGCRSPRPSEGRRSRHRIYCWARPWLDDLPGVVHARHGWHLPSVPQADLPPRVSIHELSHGGHDGREHHIEICRTRGRGPLASRLLVCHVPRPERRIRGRLPDQLVARVARPQARDDNR